MMKSFIKYMGKCTELSLLKEPEVEYTTKPSKLQAFRSWLTTHIQHRVIAGVKFAIFFHA